MDSPRVNPRRDRALILERYSWSESSLVVHVLTARHGRVHLLARGAYRPTSRYFCVLDLFDTLTLEWSAPPGRELCDLRAGEVTRRRRRIVEDLDRFRAATSVLELASLAARLGPPDPGLFALAEGALESLDAGGRAVDVDLTAFEIAYLEHLGWSPALESCAQCAGPAPAASGAGQRVAFSAAAGGRLCVRCADAARGRGLRVGTIPGPVLADARALAAGAWPPGAGSERIVRVRDLIERFVDYHLELQPRSHRAFLSVPNRNAPRASPPARPTT